MSCREFHLDVIKNGTLPPNTHICAQMFRHTYPAKSSSLLILVGFSKIYPGAQIKNLTVTFGSFSHTLQHPITSLDFLIFPFEIRSGNYMKAPISPH